MTISAYARTDRTVEGRQGSEPLRHTGVRERASSPATAEASPRLVGPQPQDGAQGGRHVQCVLGVGCGDLPQRHAGGPGQRVDGLMLAGAWRTPDSDEVQVAGAQGLAQAVQVRGV